MVGGQQFGIGEHRECLLQGVVVVRREQHRRAEPIAGDLETLEPSALLCIPRPAAYRSR